MKILYLSDDFPPHSYGGAGIIAYNDARALAQKGHDITVVTTSSSKNDVGTKTLDGLSVRVLFSDYHLRWRHHVSLNNRKIVSEISNIIDEVTPDVIHAHNIHLHISYKTLEIASRKVGKVFLTAHDLMMVHYGKMIVRNPSDQKISQIELIKNYGLVYNPFRTWLIKKYIRNLTKIFSVSKAVKDVLAANGIMNVEVLHNGIDVTEWQANADDVTDFKQKKNLVDKKVILFGGRVSTLKGGKAVLDALGEVVKKIPEARLLLIGTENEYVKNMLKNCPEEIREKVIVTGWIDRKDMKTVYSASDVVAVPSLYLDPFPTVNLEAMASRKPVVGTIFGGTPEVVEDGVTGYLIDPHDTKVFAERLVELLQNGQKAVEFGTNGFKKAAADFSIEKHLNKLLAWYTTS